ncbi:phospholipase D family protein [Psychromonas sp.]|nr:phospholipase D family protein [Psychromonas sp.]
MRITSNISNTHFSELNAIISKGCNRLLIISPFLASNMQEFLSKFDFTSIQKVELITTFKGNTPEQLTKPKQLLDFLEYFNAKHPKIKVKIHVDNHLHGKIYIASNGSNHEAIITSANFTNNGLKHNHEWGIQTKESEQIEFLIGEAFDAVEYKELTLTQLKKAVMFAEQYQRDKAWETKQPEADIDILHQVYSAESDNDKEPLYFLKPIGTKNNPVILKERRDFSDFHQNLHFSKKKPKGVTKGDIVITAGVGCGSLLGYFKVTGSLFYVTSDEIQAESWKERWPWYMEGQNQNTTFAQTWWQYDIKRKTVLEEFRQRYPNSAVTSSGCFTLGALNFGADKIQITKAFGEFLIKKINSCSPL